MSVRKQVARRAEAATGAAKRILGRATGNTRLSAEGRADRAKGNIRRAAARMKKAFRR